MSAKSAAPTKDLILAWFAVVAVPGCASSSNAPDAGTTGGCPPYVSDAALATPTVSLAGDVIPIFERSCDTGGGTCHGDPSVVTSFRQFLGYADGGGGQMTTQLVLGGLVGVKSTEDLSMNLVTAGDPAQSFLMHKMDGDQCTLVSQCMMGNSFRPNCGVFMPYQAPTLLDVPTRDTVRRWIAQGAKDN